MRFARSLAFKLTSFYALLFAASVAALCAVVGVLTSRSMERQIRAVVQRMATALVAECRTTDMRTTEELVDRRLRHGGSAYYLLQSAHRTFIAGNVRPMTPVVDAFTGTPALRPVSEATQGESPPESRAILAFGVLLADGTYIMVVEDQEWLLSVERAIRKAFLVAGLASTLLAVVGGLLLGRGVIKRIDVINRTAADIVAGRIDSRIPVTAGGGEIDDLGGNVNAMLDRIQILMVNLKQVSNDIAHDLRTPLARLRQRLEAACATGQTVGSLRDEIGQAISESDGLLETFSALLRIAQIESGSRRHGFAPVDLSALMEFVSTTFEAVAEDRDRRLLAHIQLGISVFGDRELLMQMLTNLVENAIRHTNAGCTIEMAVRREGEGAVVIVCDNGPGVPSDERAKVLRRLYRLETSRTTPGSGLGLALVAAVAELHAADLSLSDNAPGLSVRVTFPSAR